MPSLYDRLQKMQPLSEKRRSIPVHDACLVRETEYAIEPLAGGMIAGDTLAFLSKGQILDSQSPEDLLFFDTETTGLSRGAGTIAFLIGYGRIKGGRLFVTQVLMRDYPQELLLLNDFLQRVAGCGCLVSYNGANFDLPLLQSRLTMNRLPDATQSAAHLDLLYAARRIFKLRLGRCSLSRMEELVFGFVREGDLPGAEVPARYFSFLEHQDETMLDEILEHNSRDIRTLASLYLRLASLHQNPLLSSHGEDLFSLGKAYEMQGQGERAINCYKACSDRSVRDMARLRMADLYRRNRMDEEAVSEYENLRANGQFSPRLFISLAKIYEHRYRDPDRALEIARQGMLYCSERLGEAVSTDPDYLNLEYRSLRLIRKAESRK